MIHTTARSLSTQSHYKLVTDIHYVKRFRMKIIPNPNPLKAQEIIRLKKTLEEEE